jgi:flagellar FliJ protein
MESILKIKIKLEEQAKITYAEARNRLTIEEEKLSNLENKKIFFEDEQREQTKNRLYINKIKQLSEAIDIMKEKIEQQTAIVRTATQRLEIARIRLNSAMIERKTQEKLKEKAWHEYMMEVTAEEQKEIDERNSYNYSDFLLYEEDR